MSGRLVRCSAVSKRFGDRVAVEAVSFEIGAGECYALLGPNGAGKTTTISMLCGLLRPDGGAVRIEGRDPSGRDGVEARRLVGFVPQQVALFPELSVYENMDFWGRMTGLRRAQRKARIGEVLERVGLADRARHERSVDGLREDPDVIRVLLVDDQALIREGMRRVLDADAELTVVGECEDGDEVADAVRRCNPDIVVMDVRMHRVDGAAATRELNALDGPPVLILTTFDDDETVAAALGAGASGFILKDAPGEDILRSIHAVATGDAWLDPRIAGRVLHAYRSRTSARPKIDLSRLTRRELDVLRIVGRGATNQEIAAELNVSEATVKTHLGNLLAKLHLRDRAAAIVLAHDQRLC